MSNLKDQLIKLGSKNSNLQKHIRPVLSALDDTRSKNASQGLDILTEVVKKVGKDRAVGTSRMTDAEGNLQTGVEYNLYFNDSDIRNAIGQLQGKRHEYSPTLHIEQFDQGVWEAWIKNDRDGVLSRTKIQAPPSPDLNERLFRKHMSKGLRDLFSEAGKYGLELIEKAGSYPMNAYSRNQKESTMPTPDLPDGKWSPESDLSREEARELLMDALNGMARIEQKIHKEDLMRTVGRLKSWGETQGRSIQKVTEKIDKKHRKYIVAKNDLKRAFEELKKIM